MHRAGAAHAVREAAGLAHVHEGARPAAARLEAPRAGVLADRAEAERVDEHALGRLAALHPHRRRVEAADRDLRGDAGRSVPRRAGRRTGVRHELEQQPVGVAEREHPFGDPGDGAPGRLLVGDAVAKQPLDPEAERGRRDGERRRAHLPRAGPAAAGARPRKERHDPARGADLVTVVQVVALRIVEVHRALHESQAEHAGVEVDVALRVARDRADVVQAGDDGHGGPPGGGDGSARDRPTATHAPGPAHETTRRSAPASRP